MHSLLLFALLLQVQMESGAKMDSGVAATPVTVVSNPAPVITSISPTSGSFAGGTLVTVNGSNFLTGATVKFGTGSATSVSVISAIKITCISPSGSGTVSVVVTNTDGKTGTLANSYTYTSAGAFTIQNQPPITLVPYSGTIFGQQLPANIDSHRWANNGFGFSGDQIILHVWPLQTSGNGGYTVACGVSGVTSLPANCSNSTGGGIYYASASDPIYKVTTVAHAPSGNLNPAGKFFHLTNKAIWGGKTGTGGLDQFLYVWDQSSDIDSTAGGRILTSYFGTGGSPGALGNCTCATTSCAGSTPSCQVALYYGAIGYPLQDTTGYNEASQGWDTLNAASGIMDLRVYELMPNGTINFIPSGVVSHALLVNTACTANGGGVVFPAVGSGAHPCNGTGGFPTDTDRPLIGNLFYIDSGYNCSNAAAWAQPVCVGTQKYGAYITDTGGGNGNTLIGVSRIEEAFAYNLAGLTDPLFAYLRGQSSTCSGQLCLSVDSTVEKATMFFFQGMPGLVSGGVTHLHIADPCVAKQMAFLNGDTSSLTTGRCP